MASKLKVQELALQSPNGLVEKTVTVGNDGVVTINGVQAISASEALGIGQTWQNVGSNRTWETTYTNNTGKPIMVTIGFNVTASGHHYLYVNGINACSSNWQSAGNGMLTAIVPNGATYYATRPSNSTITSWNELR